jgi:hypothetical protein
MQREGDIRLKDWSTLMRDERISAALAEALAKESRSPVVGNSKQEWEGLAISAVNRIHSFHYRSVDIRDRPKAIADLAQGISADRWNNADVEGTRFQEYRRIAGILLDVYVDIVKQ